MQVTRLTTEQALDKCKSSLAGDDAVIRDMLNNYECEAVTIGECHFITRFETYQGQKVLVVMCASGKGLLQAGEVLKSLAKKSGCTSARMHTSRKGLARYAAVFGWQQKEIVYTTDL